MNGSIDKEILVAALAAAAQTIGNSPTEGGKEGIQARARHVARLAVLIARETEKELSGKPRTGRGKRRTEGGTKSPE